jgi:hypothetical protein
MQTHSAARLPSPRRSKIEVDPVKLGRELAGLTGRANLTDEEYARLASEWAETIFEKIAT